MTNIVRINGVIYPSQKAAALALGVHWTTIGRALERGSEDAVGPTATPGRTPKPVVINGVTYASQKEAAAAEGVSRSAITWRLGRDRARMEKGKAK